jgi:MFS family permease
VTRRTVVLIGLILCSFMAALEATVVSTAMPTVLGDLGGVEHHSWVFSAYLLASTVTVPVYGKPSDLYGRKPLLMFGVAPVAHREFKLDFAPAGQGLPGRDRSQRSSATTMEFVGWRWKNRDEWTTS